MSDHLGDGHVTQPRTPRVPVEGEAVRVGQAKGRPMLSWVGKRRRALDTARGAMVGTPGWRSSDEIIRFVDGLRSGDRGPWGSV